MSVDMSHYDSIRNFYDVNTARKITDFIEGNERVERAWLTVTEWSAPNPHRILEVGCGIGHICWRMSKLWKNAEVIGLDISRKSLHTATKLFGSSRVSFVEGPLGDNNVNGKFDLILMMDVYEHIRRSDRSVLHSAVRNVLEEKGKLILTFPTVRHLKWLKENKPLEIQPVDEDIFYETIMIFAKDLDRDVLTYKEISVWNEGDYAHAVIGEKGSWTTKSDRFSLVSEARKKVNLWFREFVAGDEYKLFPSKKYKIKMLNDRLG